jgi:hypothetical protein
MEVEQKARLLAETKQMLEEARRTFEEQGQVNWEEVPGCPSTMQDVLTTEKARNELVEMEQEQKAKLLEEVLELRRRELDDEGERTPYRCLSPTLPAP